jgi:hypothetical protein
VRIDPPEVTQDPSAFELVDAERSSRIGFRPAAYIQLVLVRTKWVRRENEGTAASPEMPQADDAAVDTTSVQQPETAAQQPVVHIAPLPLSVMPKVMADASAIANVIVSKYDDILPLHRQERISARGGFRIPRSTQCGWLDIAFALLCRIVLAMFNESKAQAHCIATDATSAPVQAPGGCRKWHVFSFIADNGHIVFRWVNEHSGAAISTLLFGFRGYLLSDASSIYDVLHRDHGMTAVYCWAHVRRYFWKALDTDRALACEGLAIIAKLFVVARDCQTIAMPERTSERASRARPLLELFDAWVNRTKARDDIGELLHRALGYYENQKEGLWRFLDDGQLPIHNNDSERQLRNLASGRDNWRYFVNRTGLDWYTTFRSLIASCHLHQLNPHVYLEQALRLAPHWPTKQMLALSPKYWEATRRSLTPAQLEIIRSPWDPPDEASATAETAPPSVPTADVRAA